MNLNVQRYFQTGRVPNVGTVAVQVFPSSVQLRAGLWLKADSGNPNNLFIGQSNVTAWTNPTTDGYPLRPGEEHLFTVDNVSGVYVKANVGSGNLWFWMS